eukprot:5738859-Amphidinium_carterae.1
MDCSGGQWKLLSKQTNGQKQGVMHSEPLKQLLVPRHSALSTQCGFATTPPCRGSVPCHERSISLANTDSPVSNKPASARTASEIGALRRALISCNKCARRKILARLQAKHRSYCPTFVHREHARELHSTCRFLPAKGYHIAEQQ